MAATVWSPAPYVGKQEWLLQDGTIVTSPDFEATSSGRRVRIVGTQTSVGSRQVTDLISAGIDKVATERGTKRWMRVFDVDSEQSQRASVVGLSAEVYKQAAVLHINQDNNNAYGSTPLMWDFEAPGTPLRATVFCILDQRGGRSTISTKIAWRDTNPAQASDVPSYCFWDGNNYYLGNLYRHSDEFRKVDVVVSKNGGLLPGHTIDVKQFNTQFRQAVVSFAERAKALDNVDEITLPDLRDPANPTMITFKRKTSNYSSSIHNEILALVQTGPLLEQIKQSYTALVNAMSQLGVVFTAKPGDNEFAKAANGDLTALRATLQACDDDTINRQDGLDHQHTVAIDFASGSVIVNCGHQTSGGLTEVAEAWNIAKFKAEVVGETDILLAYAEAYKTPKEQARIKKIIEQRATPDTL